MLKTQQLMNLCAGKCLLGKPRTAKDVTCLPNTACFNRLVLSDYRELFLRYPSHDWHRGGCSFSSNLDCYQFFVTAVQRHVRIRFFCELVYTKGFEYVLNSEVENRP